MFNLLLLFAIGFELQKLIQFNFFFRIEYLVRDYPNIVKKLVFFKELLAISFANLGYFLILLIGIFTINLYFIFTILLLSSIQIIIFKHIKNKTFRKISYATDIIFSIILLSLSVINSLYYHLDSIQFIKQFFNI